MEWRLRNMLLLLLPVVVWSDVREDLLNDVSKSVHINIDIDGYIILQVSPQYVEQSGNWVTIKWSYVSNPSDADWIGMFSMVDDAYPLDPENYAPIKYQYANTSSSHITYGRGYMVMRIVNMRSPVVMGFLRGGLDNCTLLSFSDTINFQNYNEPLQVHLSLSSNSNEMTVTWVSGDVLLPVVYWGPSSGDYTNVRIAQTTTYTYLDMCGSPAIDYGYIDPGLIHKGTIDGLVPGQKYYYVVGDNYGWSKEYSFTAPPLNNQSFVMVAFGDSGCSQPDDTYMVNEQISSLNVTSAVYADIENVDLLLHLGGLSDAKGYGSVWETFFDQIQSIASAVPFMVTLGVAENGLKNITNTTSYNGSQSGGECGIPFMKRFNMPWSTYDYDDMPWYSFTYGSAFFVVISTENDFTEGSVQYEFIITALMSVNRSTTPWLIVAGNRPMYTASTQNCYDQDLTDSLQGHIEPLFKSFSVDLAMWSHHHSYQRTCSVYRGYCMPENGQGTVHLVVGTGGTYLETNQFTSITPNWINYLNALNHGYVQLTVDPDLLTVDFISSELSTTLDTLVLKKSDDDDNNDDEYDIKNSNRPQDTHPQL